MPTKAGLNDMEALRLNFQEPSHSWTDDLPVCPLSGVGFATNQRYRADGFRREEHGFEDRSFHFRYDESTYFYGVFDGHAGSRAADFASQRMPAEVLLGQLSEKVLDRDVKDVLHQAFLAVEKGFFESIDDLLAEKENLRLQLQGLRTYEALKQFPEVVTRLKTVTEEIQSGTTAVVALVHHDKMYIANVGDSRAVLCIEDKNGKTDICQISCDHTFLNDDELLRLSQLGLNVDKLKAEPRFGLQNCTRYMGNYTVKGGYKEFDNLSEAVEEPIIAEPDIVSGIKIDENTKFLLLMSDGLYKSLEESTGTSNVNAMVVNMVIEQFSEQSTLNGVAQAVVDKVVRMHHDAYLKDSQKRPDQGLMKRDDITLLVRNFSFPLPNSLTTDVSSCTQASATEQHDSNRNLSNEHNTIPGNKIFELMNESDRFPMTRNETASLSSSNESAGPQVLFQSVTDMSLDEGGRIKPYVDFSDFFAEITEAHKSGLVPEDWLEPCT